MVWYITGTIKCIDLGARVAGGRVMLWVDLSPVLAMCLPMVCHSWGTGGLSELFTIISTIETDATLSLS
jgi:hypothetical protein